jgi:SAM-dependent methyltransferase
MSRHLRGDARLAYETLAPSYDAFNSRYEYERWTTRLLDCAGRAGLRGDRLLDVGCGTGLSCVVPLAHGMSVTGCDVSPAMLERARARMAGRAALVEADMRALPLLGEFDLIWSVGDPMNYLSGEEELIATLCGMRRNLDPAGIVLFDLNTLEGYRRVWIDEHRFEGGGRSFGWRGVPRAVIPGGRFEASFEGDGMETSRHRQRHFPRAQVLGAIESAGLRCVEVYGERLGELEPGLDEERHTKAVYVCVQESVGRGTDG